MAAQNTPGIQTLLDAEREASKIVAKAREYRVQRVKDARGQAAAEIEALNKKAEDDFKAFQQQHEGDGKGSAEEIDLFTQTQIVKMKNDFNLHRDAVVDKLLKQVTQVNAELHRNVRGKQE